MATEFGMSDSSGTDDDLPPSHQNRYARGGRVAGNGRSTLSGPTPLPRLHNDMETQIHLIEQEAYSSVLRAFKAQSDAITWEKESLITELRKELRVSDDEHRELLSRVNADDMIRRIREWRKANGLQPGMMSASQPLHESIPSPTAPVPRKKQKGSQPIASLPVAPSPSMHPSMQPSSSTLRRGHPPGPNKKTKQNYSSVPPSRAQVSNHGSSGGFGAIVSAAATNYDPLIGRKVWLKWEEDNTFYEAIITDYDPSQGKHLLTYDYMSGNEQYEWVNLKEFSPEDIRWDGDDPGISQNAGRGGGGAGRGAKKSGARASAPPGGRGRGSTKGQSKKDMFLSQNGVGRKQLGEIELLHTDTLIKEVEKIFSGNHPDPSDVEKAMKVLKEHEQALVDAIARLEDASDGESDGDHRFSQGGHMMDQERVWRKRQYDEMGGEGRALEGPEGEKIARAGKVASEKLQDGD